MDLKTTVTNTAKPLPVKMHTFRENSFQFYKRLVRKNEFEKCPIRNFVKCISMTLPTSRLQNKGKDNIKTFFIQSLCFTKRLNTVLA